MKKTYYLDISLMLPMQNDKEIIFNESQLLLDNFVSSAINDFIDELPNKAIVGQKYILLNGDFKNHICYCSAEIKSWQFIAPKDNMFFFILKKNNFFFFHNHNWHEYNQIELLEDKSQKPEQKFISIKDFFELNIWQNHFYFYLLGDCELKINISLRKNFTICIKQSKNFQIIWPNNILWPNDKKAIISQSFNQIDLIKFYPLIESNHWLAKIIGQSYNY